LKVKRWGKGSTALLVSSRAQTARLREAKKFHKPSNPGLFSYALVRAANPKRRTKRFRRKMSRWARKRIASEGPFHPEHKTWTRQEEKLLGKLPDTELAKKL